MHSDFQNFCSKYLINVLYFKKVRKFSTSQQNNIYRVEFSKPNIEILVTVTNASKLQSVGWLYNHKSSFSSKCSSSFSSSRFSSFLAMFLYRKKSAKSKFSGEVYARPCNNVQITKKCSENSVFAKKGSKNSVFEYPSLGH